MAKIANLHARTPALAAGAVHERIAAVGRHFSVVNGCVTQRGDLLRFFCPANVQKSNRLCSRDAPGAARAMF